MTESKVTVAYASSVLLLKSGVFLSRGKLLDFAKKVLGSKARMRDVITCNIITLLDEDLLADGQKTIVQVSTYQNPDDESPDVKWYSEAFFNKLDAAGEFNASPNCSDVKQILKLKLNTEMYTEPTYPLKVKFNYDDEGTIYTRLVTHPNDEGLLSGGKLFFPDRSWKSEDLFAGEAMVKIKFEKDNYGILLGKMIKPRTPSYEALCDYLWDSNTPGSTEIAEFYLPQADTTVYACKFDYALEHLTIYTLTDETEQNPTGVTTMELDVRNGDKHIARIVEPVYDILLKSRFGDAFEINEILKNYKECSFQRTRKNPRADNAFGVPRQVISQSWLPSSAMTGVECLDWAISNGIFELRSLEFNRVFSVKLNIDNLPELCKCESLNSIVDLFNTATDFNAKADAAIYSLFRKGILRFL